MQQYQREKEVTKAELEAEERLDKKLRRILRNSGWSAGLGAGLLLVHLFFPGDQAGSTNRAFAEFGAVFFAYGVSQLIAVIFLRKLATKINLLLTYLLLPAALIKLALEF